MGTSLVDDEKLEYCANMLKKAQEKGVKMLLPVDTVITTSFPDPIDAEISVEYVDSDKIPADKMGLDIGPQNAPAVCRRGEGCQDGGVERPHGRV